MDESLKHHNTNPVLTANLISRLFFGWMNTIFKIGYDRRLEIEDMYNVVPEDQSDVLGSKLEKEWTIEVERYGTGERKPSLLKCLFKVFGLKYTLLGLILFLEESLKVAQPLLLRQLIYYFTVDSTMPQQDAYLYAMGNSLCAIGLVVLHHPYFFGAHWMGMKMRVACCSLIYRKAMRLSNYALGQTTTGQIVNLMSNDAPRFDKAAVYLHFLWIGPLEAIAVLAILWMELGPLSLSGFAVLFLLVPIQARMGKFFAKYRQKTAVQTGQRLHVMNEIVSGIRVIKMYCWEKPIEELVEKLRSLEMHYVWQTQVGSFLTACVWVLGPRLLYFSIVMAAAFTGHIIRASSLYVCLPLLFLVAQTMMGCVSVAIQKWSELWVSIKRMQTFIMLEELESESQSRAASSQNARPDDCFVTIKDVTAMWDKTLNQNTLHKISTTVKTGQLLAVIGPVGSGKSSLLMSVLRELPLLSGSIEVNGRVAYVAQKPWVFSASLKQNITFGNPYQKQKYDRIIKACALKKDIKSMPHEDNTYLGDQGVNLSGGQRARISLARAVYMDADVYLLDDPLSAVDSTVGRHLFERVIQGLLKDKPRILVTHQLQYVKDADQILILEKGEIVKLGTFDELLKSGVDLVSLIKRDQEEVKTIRQHSDTAVRYRSNSTRSRNESCAGDVASNISLSSIGTEIELDEVQLPEAEEHRVDTVRFGIYVEYFKAGAGILKFILLSFLCLAAQGACVISDWWLSYWSNNEEAIHAAVESDSQLKQRGYNETNITIPYMDIHFNAGIFSGIIGAVFLFGFLRAFMFFRVAVDASKNLHNQMFKKIMRAQIGFFDANPAGRILNRFSKDIDYLDDLLPVTLFDFLQCFFLIVGNVIMVGVVNPWVFIPTVPLSIIFIVIRRYYLRTSRHIKRLQGTTRSPVLSHLSASIQGLQTIRASNMQETFIEEFDNHQDLHSEACFLFFTSCRWLAVRLDWLCALFVTGVSFCCVFAAVNLNPGLVGLSMTYATSLMVIFEWGVRQSAEVENQPGQNFLLWGNKLGWECEKKNSHVIVTAAHLKSIVSVERVLDYSNLPSEALLESEDSNKPPPGWPADGVIKCENAALKYGDDKPLVLQDLNFTINGKEKIGIVGRTGAGKSSIITLLFRLVEPCSGRIFIDGVDIKEIGLHDLRYKISIIPQDPVLFTTTLRRNLDPFSEHEDIELWNSLEEVQLKEAIQQLPNGINTEVSEGGINFSVGQRQLICLARATLRQNRILIIDEATANVDQRNDQLIQKMIKERFCNCTVLTIAHRLDTIMDSDRIMVFDEGRVIEFDHPQTLLQNPEGIFYKMVQHRGRF